MAHTCAKGLATLGSANSPALMDAAAFISGRSAETKLAVDTVETQRQAEEEHSQECCAQRQRKNIRNVASKSGCASVGSQGLLQRGPRTSGHQLGPGDHAGVGFDPIQRQAHRSQVLEARTCRRRL